MSKGGSGLWRTAAFWSIAAALPLSALVVAIGVTSYWSVPRYPLRFEGDPLVVYDSEIGFVPWRNARIILSESYGGQFPVYTDRRGARVSKPGEQVPDRVDILFIGDSFTWGQGVTNDETFAFKVAVKLGRTAANLAFAAYGTTQSLQVLRRNRDLEPKLVVYTLIGNHLRRNVSPCAPSYYPFCIDTAYVAAGSAGHAAIRSPRTNGVRRLQLQIRYEQNGLDPITWLVHGADVAIGRGLSRWADSVAADPAVQRIALHYLLGEMKAAVEGIGAKLLIVFVPTLSDSAPAALMDWTRDHHVEFLDIATSRKTRGSGEEFYLQDRHPSAAGHAFLADEISARIQAAIPEWTVPR